MLTIGEFARVGGVTAKALRHYGRLDLFTPVWVDPMTGYRWYSPAQLPELRRILALRDLGIPLDDIVRLRRGGADLREVLDRRREELESTRREIDLALAALEIRVEADHGGPDVVVRTVDDQLVAGIRTTLRRGGTLDPLFLELETAVRDAGVRLSHPPGVLLHGSGDVEVYVPVRKPLIVGRVNSRRLPGGRFASAIHRGSYDGVRRLIDDLERWMAHAGLVEAGPTRVVYLQFGAEPELELPQAYLATEDDDYLTEVQIPVE